MEMNLQATLSTADGVFAHFEKKSNPTLGEIGDFADNFLNNLGVCITAKSILEHLNGKYPSIDVSIDIGDYEDIPFTIENPVAEVLEDPVLPPQVDDGESLFLHTHDCAYMSLHGYMRSDLIRLLLDTIESSISK